MVNATVSVVHGDVEDALKRLRKKLSHSGLFGELKKKGAYIPRSDARRFKSHRARLRIIKNLRRRNEGQTHRNLLSSRKGT